MAARLFRQRSGFTLVELLVSITILSMLAVLLLQMLSSSSDIWRRNRERTEAFKAARVAFERVTSNLSQATLDTYLDYFNGSQSRTDAARTSGGVPADFNFKRYDWASDLQFVAGKTDDLVTTASGATPTDAVFFVAPAGRVARASTNYRNLDKLLNAMGYYIEFSSDHDEIPAFLRGRVKERFRYRLKELNQPSEKLAIFKDGKFKGAESWFNRAITPAPGTESSTFTLADNVIALIVRPKASKSERSAIADEIESKYAFDSKGYLDGGSSILKNQLPPLVQLTMVTIDEISAARYAERNGDGAPEFVSPELFKRPEQFDSDMETLKKHLTDLGLKYRVFTTDVSMRGAKTNLVQ